jgi:hypothetical protein
MTQNESKPQSQPPKPTKERPYLKPLLLGVAAGAVVFAAAVALEIIPPALLGLDGTTPLSVVIPATSRDDCKHPPPIGHRPRCAYTVWNQGIRQCKIIDYKAPTCACYEGELRSCQFSSPDAPCSPLASGTCGLKQCNVTDDTHSSWGTCASP